LGSFLVDFEGLSLVQYFGRSATVTIPDGIRVLLPSCFSMCPLLSSLRIPSSVDVLCSNCFDSCDSLREITFSAPSLLSLIESPAFFGCPFLELIRLPESRQDLYTSIVWYSIV
jgi:hypothetical protein